MAYEELPTNIVIDEGVRADWGNQIGENFENHEDRISDLEESADDHEERIDLLEADGPSADRTLVATVTLTDAQIKALPTTAITVISAPAINFRVKLHQVTYFAWFQNGAYTNVNTTSAELYLQTSSAIKLGGYLANDGGASLTTLTSLLAAASVLTVDTGPYLTNAATTYLVPLINVSTGSVDGKAVQIFATNNGAGNFTGGHPSNLFTVSARYSLEAVPAYYMPLTLFNEEQQHRRVRPKRRRTDGNQSGQM